MAQTFCLLTIESSEYIIADVIDSIPDEEDIIAIAQGEDVYDDLECTYSAYNIGEGESYTDEFYSNEEILQMWKRGELNEGYVGEYEMEEFTSGTIHANSTED